VSYVIAMGFKVKCVPVLDKVPCCCCSCDLKLATCILGWLGLIGNIGNLLRGAFSLAVFEDFEDIPPHDTKAVLIAEMVSAAMGIIVMGLLLYGAHNEKPKFMLPAVILDMIGIVILAVAVLGISILLFFSSFLIGFVFLLVGILIVVILTFFWVVIYSYYRKLEERQYQFCAAPLDHDGKQVTMHIGHT